jgi:hypothetical protein
MYEDQPHAEIYANGSIMRNCIKYLGLPVLHLFVFWPIITICDTMYMIPKCLVFRLEWPQGLYYNRHLHVYTLVGYSHGSNFVEYLITTAPLLA